MHYRELRLPPLWIMQPQARMQPATGLSIFVGPSRPPLAFPGPSSLPLTLAEHKKTPGNARGFPLYGRNLVQPLCLAMAPKTGLYLLLNRLGERLLRLCRSPVHPGIVTTHAERRAVPFFQGCSSWTVPGIPQFPRRTNRARRRSAERDRIRVITVTRFGKLRACARSKSAPVKISRINKDTSGRAERPLWVRSGKFQDTFAHNSGIMEKYCGKYRSTYLRLQAITCNLTIDSVWLRGWIKGDSTL